MATNNAINLKDNGIASYDGSGTFSALANPLTVANGGQGNSSLTAYAVLCGGTTTTNPVQSIASVGTSGQVLKSNGAGALPSFSGGSSGYSLYFSSLTASNPSASSTYFIRPGSSMTSVSLATASGTKIYVPKSGTLVCGGFMVSIGGTLGSNENVSIYARLNNTTDIAISTTSQWTSTPITYVNSGLSSSVSAGDYFQIKIVTPAWTTNPASVDISISLIIV